jgi:alpha-glucosidase (family GH31 glycosyl hydrolase)
VRPLVLVDSSPQGRAVDDQWMLGDDILVAPVVVQGAVSRSVYLPAGSDWQQVTVGEDGSFVPTGDISPGGTTVVAPAPLTDIPIFLRS